MRPISKGPEPADFSHWKRRKRPSKKSPWDTFSGEEPQLKSKLKETLLVEQGYVCCYCEQRIDVSNSHIEHLASRDTTPQRVFDYQNLLACCLKPAQCGNLKGNSVLKVHPLLPNCREYFRFIGNGEILPTEAPGSGAMAQEAITTLGLTINALNAQRKSAITAFTQTLSGMNPEQARALLARLDARDEQGRNAPFASAILAVLKPRPHTR